MDRLNPMSFDLCNHSLKTQGSTGTSTPKVGVPLGVWGFIPSHSFTLPRAWNVTPGLPSWPALLQALALVASPRLGLQQNCCCLLHNLLRNQVDFQIEMLMHIPELEVERIHNKFKMLMVHSLFTLLKVERDLETLCKRS
jgi:hypothetical protein